MHPCLQTTSGRSLHFACVVLAPVYKEHLKVFPAGSSAKTSWPIKARSERRTNDGENMIDCGIVIITCFLEGVMMELELELGLELEETKLEDEGTLARTKSL